MPVTGCPKSRKFLWSEGYLRQNTEDTSPMNNWSRPMHLKGLKKNNEITQQFCVKNNRAGHRDWPAGKYCIYKRGKCPIGKNAPAVIPVSGQRFFLFKAACRRGLWVATLKTDSLASFLCQTAVNCGNKIIKSSA